MSVAAADPAVDNASTAAKPARFELVAILIGKVLVAAAMSQSVWIAAVMSSGTMSTADVGSLASGVMICSAAGTILITLWGRLFSPRLTALCAALLIAAANLVALIPVSEAFVFGRLLGGAGAGALAACLINVIGRRADALKIFSIVSGATMITGMGINLLLPTFMSEGGLYRLFATTVGIALIAALAVAYRLPNERIIPKAKAARKASGGFGVASILCCLAFAIIGVAANALGPYWIVIGQHLGFDVATLGYAGAMAGPFALLGPIAAHRLGERFGLMGPVFIAFVVMVASWVIQAHAPVAFVWGASAAIGGVAAGFSAPYLMALLNRLDPSGRTLSVTPALILLGSAAGPKLGSMVIAVAPTDVLAPVAAGLVLVALGLLALAAAQNKAAPSGESDAQDQKEDHATATSL